MVITTTQLHLTKPKLRFCACSNPAHGIPYHKNKTIHHDHQVSLN